MSTSQQKTLEDFIQLQQRNALAHAIRAAVELGVIASLREGQKTAKQLADELNIDFEALIRLLNVLTATELVEVYGDDYALSAIAKLIPDQFFDLGDQHWRHLAAHVRTGVPLPARDGVAITDVDYKHQKASEEWTLTPTALAAAQVLDLAKTRKGSRILEIYCGSAVFGATLAHTDPESIVYLLDDVFGIERAHKTIESIGLDAQVNFITADPDEDLTTIPELTDQSFDLVLVAGKINRLSQKKCKDLFNQLHQLIKMDGELVLIDVFPGQEKGELDHSIFDLELRLRNSEGQLHDPSWLKEVLVASGFSQIQFAHLPSLPYYWGLLLAQRDEKPSAETNE